MIIRIIACWSILQATGAVSARCLTGYMTDVQSWVDEEGALTPTIEWSNAIDVSLEPNAVTSLQYKMMMFRSGPQRYIQYLAMAKCKLNRVPSIFKLSDSEGRPLEQTVQYMTLYGNTFVDESLPGQEYDVMLNATKSTMITNDTVFALSGTAIWSTGLRKSKFPKLIELDLRACSIQVLDSQAFRGMPNLEALYLGENNIVFIDGNAFVGLRKLVHLDLSRNQALDETTEYTIVFGSIRAFRNMPNLKSLDLSNTKLQQSNLQALTYLGRSMQRLSLCYTGLSKLGESIFNSTSMKYLDLSGNPGILAENSNPLHAVADTLQVLYAESIMAKSLAPFKPLTKVQILKIGKNEIATIEEGDLSNFTSLQILDMDKNRITAWRSPLFSKIPQLSFLSLRENNINVIYDTMINDFENLSYLALSGNFIICNCYTRELFEVAARNQRNYQRTLIEDVNNVTLNVHKAVNYHIGYEEYNNMIVQRTDITRRPCNVESGCDDQDYALEVNGSYVIVDYDDRLYQCLLVEEGKSVYFSEIYTCNQRMLLYDTAIDETWHKLVALIVLPIVLFPLLGFAFMYRKNFRYWLLSMKNIAILSLIEKKGNSNGEAIFHYDIFVSYCNEDRAWVMDNLLPHLETDCNISVCLHERDFQVGLSILENIVSCMDRSRAIMLILSKRFLLSQWCQFEMHLAQHRLLETRREDLILVLLEDIPRRVRPTTLHYLMLTKTYIVWPKGEEEQTIFWRRMKKCVVTQKLIQTENHSLA